MVQACFFFLSVVYLHSKINGRDVWSMLIPRSSGMLYASTTFLIDWWKEKPISFRKLGDTGCFAVVAGLAMKNWWHDEKFKFKLPPFSSNKVRSFAKTTPLPIAMAMLWLTTHPDCLILFIICRALSSNSDKRRDLVPQCFLGSPLSFYFQL